MKKIYFILIALVFSISSYSQQLDSIVHYSQDALTNPIYRYATVNQYNNLQQLSFQFQFDFQPSINDTIYKVSYSYYPSGMLKEKIIVSRNSNPTQSYNFDRKTTYLYDNNGNKLSEIETLLDTLNYQWVQYIKRDWTYDAQNKMQTFLTSYWHNDSLYWNPTFRTSYMYNNIDSLYERIDEMNQSPTHVWELLNKYVRTYNASNKLDEMIQYSRNHNNTGWIEQYKYNYSYLSGNTQIKEDDYDWDWPSSSWKYLGYNLQYFSSNGLLQKLERYKIDNWTNNLEKKYMKLYFYTDGTLTNVSKINSNPNVLYPNPIKTGNTLHISNSQIIEIIDLNGKTVLKEVPMINNTLSMNGIKPGYYFVKLLSDSGDTITKQIVVQ